jgi:putative salt-induced outer membrane protein YdiY
MVRTSDRGEATAEQYFGTLRAKRKLTDRIDATTGIRLERDHLGGIDFRSLLDGGLAYKVVQRPEWTLDGLTTIAWNHEERVTGEVRNEAQAALGLASKYTFGTAAETTQRYVFLPNFTNSTAYRQEAEVTAQASMNRRLALKFGFLWRYSHDPVPGFKSTDTTTTASIVVRWRGPAVP